MIKEVIFRLLCFFFFWGKNSFTEPFQENVSDKGAIFPGWKAFGNVSLVKYNGLDGNIFLHDAENYVPGSDGNFYLELRSPNSSIEQAIVIPPYSVSTPLSFEFVARVNQRGSYSHPTFAVYCAGSIIFGPRELNANKWETLLTVPCVLNASPNPAILTFRLISCSNLSGHCSIHLHSIIRSNSLFNILKTHNNSPLKEESLKRRVLRVSLRADDIVPSPTSQPSSQPTEQPSGQPSLEPTEQPSGQPSLGPSVQPSFQPVVPPSIQPFTFPTSQPSFQPSIQPSSIPSQILELNKTFSYTGYPEYFIVPSTVFILYIEACGAAGGNAFNGNSYGGLGGCINATIPVMPRETLIVWVGGAGGSGSNTIGNYPNGGFNGGGSGRLNNGGGGGASDIRRLNNSLFDRILVAGGGGGAGTNVSGRHGGAGGGFVGGDGAHSESSCIATAGHRCWSTGGSQSTGGRSSSTGTSLVHACISDGQFGQGGQAPSGCLSDKIPGGGGGWYGGGGGGDAAAAGGSSYCIPSGRIIDNAQGMQLGNGYIRVYSSPTTRYPSSRPSMMPSLQPSQQPSSNPTSISCPPGYSFDRVGLGCFKFIASDFDWFQARDDCSSRSNGWLATLTSENDASFLRPDTDGFYWIGYNDIKRDRHWTWLRGGVSSYTNWATNEPNGNFRENCAGIFKDGNLKDINCNSKITLGYVCQTCDQGKYSLINASPLCQPCPIDTYSNQTGASGCIPCPVGMYTDGKTGWTSCISLPTSQPSSFPSWQPSMKPSAIPTQQPSLDPSMQPYPSPSRQPSQVPTFQPSSDPSRQPSEIPTVQPTRYPSIQPSTLPSGQPSSLPTNQPAPTPTRQPSFKPTTQPSNLPSMLPSPGPSHQPCTTPSKLPTANPTLQPSVLPSKQPSVLPSAQPSTLPSDQPSTLPSGQPSAAPSGQPSTTPSEQPSSCPSCEPTLSPTTQPSVAPSNQPSSQPTIIPSSQPTVIPSAQPSNMPSGIPSRQPSGMPSSIPSWQPSSQPSTHPSIQPSTQPSSQPSVCPSADPSIQPSSQPSCQPSEYPSSQPSILPSTQPTLQPSGQPSSQPFMIPTSQPSSQPVLNPTSQPSLQPFLIPSNQPKGAPSCQPTSTPSCQPSGIPSWQPSSIPSNQPTNQPSAGPSKEAFVWTLIVNNFTDDVPVSMRNATTNTRILDDYEWHCWPQHMKERQTNRCNLRLALHFCVHRVPWMWREITECKIILPAQSEIMIASELQLLVGTYMHPSETSSNRSLVPPIKISIDGHGSHVRVISPTFAGTRFLATKLNPILLSPPSSTIVYMNSANPVQSNDHLLRDHQTLFRHLVDVHVEIRNLNITVVRVNINRAVQKKQSLGGVLMLSDIQSLQISNVSIEGGNAWYGGGGLFLSQIPDIKISRLNVSRCVANNGGALMIVVSDTVDIIDSYFTSNRAGNIGGAIAIESVNAITLVEVTLISNVAGRFGGGISFHNVRNSSSIIKSQLISNVAIFGSAVVMARCPNVVDIGGNHFERNIAKEAGTLYWLLQSNMTDPVGFQALNSFQSNQCASYGCPIGTDLSQISMPPLLSFDNYDPTVFPVEATVALGDYYGNIPTMENDTRIEASILSELDKNCGTNQLNSKLLGDMIVEVSRGVAQFKRLSGNCIPGGTMNITFTASVKTFGSKFPLYEVGLVAFSSLLSSRPGYLTQIGGSVVMRFRHCQRGEVYRDGRCVLCADGVSVELNPDNSITQCQECPRGAVSCMGWNTILKEGTWRWNMRARSIYPCPLQGACKGGNETGEALCERGYSGPLCGICMRGYTKTRSKCTLCDNSSFNIAYVAIIIVILLLVIGYRRFHSMRFHVLPTVVLEIPDVSANKSSNVNLTRAGVFGKIMVTSCQMVSNSPLKYHVGLAPLFEGLNNAFSFFNFDVLQLVPISCYNSFGFLDAMLVATIFPIVAIAILYCVYTVDLGMLVRSSQKKRHRKEIQRTCRTKYWSIFLVFTSFILPDVTLKICQSFHCINIDPHNESNHLQSFEQLRLASDLSVLCSSSRYQALRAWAIIMFMVYPVGLPALYCYILWKYRGDIEFRNELRNLKMEPPVRIRIRNQKLRKRVANSSFVSNSLEFSFIFSSYKPSCWYWEIVEISRRLIFSTVLTMSFNEGSIDQLITGFILACGYLYIHQKMRPYDHRDGNNLAEVSHYQLAICFFLYWMIKERRMDNFGRNAYENAGVAILLVNVAVVIVVVIYLFLEVVIHRNASEGLVKDLSISSSKSANVLLSPSEHLPIRHNEISREHQKQLAYNYLNAHFRISYNYLYPSLNLSKALAQREFNMMLLNWQTNDVSLALKEIAKNIIAKNRMMPAALQIVWYIPRSPQIARISQNYNESIVHEDVSSQSLNIRFEREYCSYFHFIFPMKSQRKGSPAGHMILSDDIICYAKWNIEHKEKKVIWLSQRALIGSKAIESSWKIQSYPSSTAYGNSGGDDKEVLLTTMANHFMDAFGPSRNADGALFSLLSNAVTDHHSDEDDYNSVVAVNNDEANLVCHPQEISRSDEIETAVDMENIFKSVAGFDTSKEISKSFLAALISPNNNLSDNDDDVDGDDNSGSSVPLPVPPPSGVKSGSIYRDHRLSSGQEVAAVNMDEEELNEGSGDETCGDQLPYPDVVFLSGQDISAVNLVDIQEQDSGSNDDSDSVVSSQAVCHQFTQSYLKKIDHIEQWM